VADELAKATVRITPDTTGFTEDLDAKVEEATRPRDARGRFVKIGADTTGFSEDVRAKVDESTKPATVKISADTAAALLRLADVRVRLTDLQAKTYAARVNVNSDKAQADLLGIEASLLRIGRTTANPKINLEGVVTAEAQLAALKVSLDGVGGSLAGGGSAAGGGAGGAESGGGGLAGAFGSAASAIGPFGLAIAGLVPLLAPVGGSLITGAVALASSFTAGGLALGGFGAVAMTNLSNATTASQELLAAQKAVNDATTAPARNDALAKQAALVQQIGAPTIALATAMKSLSDQWKSFAEAFQPQTLELFQTAASGLAKVLPEITPVIAAGAIAVNLVAKEFVAALASPAGKAFFSWVATEAGPIILSFADIFAKFGAGVISIMEAFTPLTNLFVGGLDNAANSFAKWAAALDGTAGFRNFIAYMQTNGPLLVKTLGDIGMLALNLIIDLAPVGAFMLRAIDDIVQALNVALPYVRSFFQAWPEFFGDAIGVIANLMADFVQAVEAGFGGILHGAAAAFSWVPGLGSGLKDAAASFDSFANTAITDLHNVAAAAALIGVATTSSAPFNSINPQVVNGYGAPAASAAPASPLSSILAQFNAEMNSFKLGTGAAPADASGVPGGLSGSGAPSAAVTAAANNAQGLAAILGLNLMQSLAQGITTGTNPLTQAFTNINQKLTGQAQTLGTALESIFSSALAFGQQAAASLAYNVTGAPTVGTYTSIYMDAQGRSTTTQQSQTVGSAMNTLFTDQKFVADIKKAGQMGLSPAFVQQFIAAGPSSLSVLDALVNSAPGTIGQLNAVNSQITALGGTYGYQAAMDKYGTQETSLLAQIRDLLAAAPAATGAHVGTAISTAAKTPQLRAATTPSKGVLARVN